MIFKDNIYYSENLCRYGISFEVIKPSKFYHRENALRVLAKFYADGKIALGFRFDYFTPLSENMHLNH